MLWNKQELNTKTVTLLQGEVISVNSVENIYYVLEVVKVLLDASYNSTDVIASSFKYQDIDTATQYYLNLSCTNVGCLLSIIVDSAENPIDTLDQPEGVLAYVYNILEPIYSELGFVYFERVGDAFFRIA